MSDHCICYIERTESLGKLYIEKCSYCTARDMEIVTLKAKVESLEAIVREQNVMANRSNEENRRNYNDMVAQRDAAKLEVERLHKKLVRSLDPTGH